MENNNKKTLTVLHNEHVKVAAREYLKTIGHLYSQEVKSNPGKYSAEDVVRAELMKTDALRRVSKADLRLPAKEQDGLSGLYNAHIDLYKRFEKSGASYLRNVLEKAKKENRQPESWPWIHSADQQEYFDLLQPYYAELRRLPPSESTLHGSQNWKYSRMRKQQHFYPAMEVMDEQDKKDIVQPEILMMIARAMRKDHAEIDVLKLNPLDVLKAFVVKKKHAEHEADWCDTLRCWGRDENGNRLENVTQNESPKAP